MNKKIIVILIIALFAQLHSVKTEIFPTNIVEIVIK
jgi:hypothetical protein